jgi:amidase
MGTVPRDLPAAALPQRLSTEQILALNARDVRQLFDNGTLTIPGLLSQLLLQINKENRNGLKLRAIVSLAPEASLWARAEAGKLELRSNRSRGPLHGIPIVLKVAISLDPSARHGHC